MLPAQRGEVRTASGGMRMDPALLGFLTIGVFLVLTFTVRSSVIIWLVLIPTAAALAGGFGASLSDMVVDGLRTVVPVATMILFAVLYFGLMIDAGLFDPLVGGLTRMVRDDPVRLCLVTAALPMLVALDGDGSTTFLISITALLPLHRRMGLNATVLPGVVALAAGVMNMLPWGGPVARAMAALGGDVGQLFTPLVPAMLAGIAWVFVAAWLIGRGEKRRLAIAGMATVPEPAPPPAAAPPDRLFWFNGALTALVIALLFQDLYAHLLPLPKMPPALVFMAAFAIALPLNRRGLPAQQDQFASHAANAVLVTSLVLAAGVFTGVLNGTGMIKAMATTLATTIPAELSPWLAQIVAVTSMPLSLVFTADAYYFGMLPVFAEAARATGGDPMAIGRAAALGQMTTGFPVSPLTAATFVLLGLSGVSLREHQRFTFKWAFATTLVMTGVAWMTGAI
jgi:CitMHS family citrate-Mg2+:H+ or citrate-Ca2+:H+ symporter